ncbi:MAG TPA: hypothetical protein VFA95_04255 [Gammaproteobacteria bacterium]|nr:hypothetical protein [Gammaproteobacteria bacterium]
MDQSLIIEPRYCGPPSSVDGGYATGLPAQALDEPAEVTLRRPRPLRRRLRVARATWIELRNPPREADRP